MTGLILSLFFGVANVGNDMSIYYENDQRIRKSIQIYHQTNKKTWLSYYDFARNDQYFILFGEEDGQEFIVIIDYLDKMYVWRREWRTNRQ